jgi:hypothetical protein
MKKTRLIFLLLALTAAAWSLPGLAQAKNPAHSRGNTASMFDGGSAFDGSSAFDGH